MTDSILLKPDAQAKCAPVEIRTGEHGPYGYVTLTTPQGDFIQIVGERRLLSETFAKLASRFKSLTVAQADSARLKLPLPDDPYEAWPVLIDAFPWLFSDIDLSKEPYACYLKGRHQAGPVSLLEQDLAQVAHLDDPSLADISEALTGSRQYGGATYTRIKAVKEALDRQNSTTTTPVEAGEAQEEQNKAA